MIPKIITINSYKVIDNNTHKNSKKNFTNNQIKDEVMLSSNNNLRELTKKIALKLKNRNIDLPLLSSSRANISDVSHSNNNKNGFNHKQKKN